ncbi:hypothetical protein SAMN05444156_1774 [Verrucomicrobium sp. GAS474]|uniref:hypothetical protein n=1 Tax=Verrucomicrobium sp. GAS474 TaxID=1882831 RepID=UPI00087BB6EC|nr:hypothetical protein [Verrucomicrobium sp. GAS474]SDU06822.1 hypothetical protein SAMN05444156_1774 [Verrucomicrobium sp. GAS474]
MRSPWKSVFKWSVVVAAVVGIVYFAHPYTWPGEQYNKAVAMKAVFNGKQIAFLLHEKEGHRPRYPSEFPPGTTAVAYLNYLVKDGLLSEEDRKLLSIPGIPAVPPGIALSDRFIGFTLFRISPDDPPKTVFLITKSKFPRYHVAIITKDGEAHLYDRKDAFNILEQDLAAGRIPAAMPLEAKSP